MVRPQDYHCAGCGRSWSLFFPRVTCVCGSDVLKRALRCGLGVTLADIVSHAWTPYPVGNGQEGDNTYA